MNYGVKDDEKRKGGNGREGMVRWIGSKHILYKYKY